MEKLSSQLKKPLNSALIGLFLGTIIGLPILGWGLMPVKWIDASAEQLRDDVRVDYLGMAIESYNITQNEQTAKMRWQELGAQADGALGKISINGSINEEQITQYIKAIGVEKVAQLSTPETSEDQENVTLEKDQNEKPSLNLIILLVVFGILTLIIGGTLAYLLIIRKRTNKPEENEENDPNLEDLQTEQDLEEQKQPQIGTDGHELPIAQYITTYTFGNDLYDDSFSIDSPAGEFLGECGVGVSEHIGVGEPKKVTAFEVWLFDKNDIQTITKVLMSEHAFTSPEINQKLVSKGEPVVIQPGQQISLETATLQLEARVVDMNYGQGAMPPNSYFERLILELAIWPKSPV